MTTEIEFKMRAMAGFNPKDTRGLGDRRLLTGDQKLYAVQDSNLWYVKYDKGSVPIPLQQKFTNYNQFMKYVTSYFRNRNIEIVEE
jgi:hypothetical protein